MGQVFISYRQTSDEQRKRVRDFAEGLRDCGIEVILDQFLLDKKGEGPDEGWPKWSRDRALNTDFVIIAGTKEWFDCFEGKQEPGSGLGAACEARTLFDRIYGAGQDVSNIRIVLFDKDDATHISKDIKRYHYFQADSDFNNIVRWLGGTLPVNTALLPKLHTSIRNNLPTLQPFFGREAELKKIAEALEPESRTWGALIDGPGGMGKTSLAVRAAYNAKLEDFDRIIFVTLKSRELDDDGVRDLSGFLISGLMELFNELARELGKDEITKATEEVRPRMLLDALRDSRTLLLLDNLESLTKSDRNTLFTFIKRLPQGCKAVLTSRGRIGSGAEELILVQLDEQAALDTLEELATHNPALQKATTDERLALYKETGGKPLLLRWTAGQIGRNSCRTIPQAIDFLRSCPPGNDPLEFIFGDLIDDFSAEETEALCALTYFTLPAKVEHIAELAGCPLDAMDTALRSLANRSLAVPTEEQQTYTLLPLVADFLRKKRPEVVKETGNRLEKQAYALVIKNGFKNHECFPILNAAWPIIAAALPFFLSGSNDRLQVICDALFQHFNYNGRYDESLVLNSDAERYAISKGDWVNAGRRAYEIGWVCSLRGQSAEVLACAERAAAHWKQTRAGDWETSAAFQLRGTGYQIAGDYRKAIAAFRKAVDIDKKLNPGSKDVAIDLNDLAVVEAASGDYVAADRHLREALRIAKAIGDNEMVAGIPCGLAALALNQGKWVEAEVLAREALPLTEKLGRIELVAMANQHLAIALVQNQKKAEALPFAQRAVELYTHLGLPELARAQKLLADCEG